MFLILNHTWMSHGVDGELDILIFDIIYLFSLKAHFYLAVLVFIIHYLLFILFIINFKLL